MAIAISRWQSSACALLLFAGGAALSPHGRGSRCDPGDHPGRRARLANVDDHRRVVLANPAAARYRSSSQRLIQLPAMFSPLVDPTSTLLTVANNASGLPGFALGLAALHRLWPAPPARVGLLHPPPLPHRVVTGAVACSRCHGLRYCCQRQQRLHRSDAAGAGLPRARHDAAFPEVVHRLTCCASGADKTEADLSPTRCCCWKSCRRVRPQSARTRRNGQRPGGVAADDDDGACRPHDRTGPSY